MSKEKEWNRGWNKILGVKENWFEFEWSIGVWEKGVLEKNEVLEKNVVVIRKIEVRGVKIKEKYDKEICEMGIELLLLCLFFV